MALMILRSIFVMVAIGLAVSVIFSGVIGGDDEWKYFTILGGIPALSLAIIVGDIAIRRKELGTISAVYFGLIVGMFMAYVAGIALTSLFANVSDAVAGQVNLGLGLLFCYICISLLLQTRHDFRFIIPYVEFSREVKGSKPCVLDTSVVIDGRIADVVETQILDSQLIMPKFVIGELQGIADSSDKLRRSRGRRGLDILNRMQNNPSVEIEIFDRELAEFAGQPVDLKLVILAKHLDGKLITNDYNLNKVAKLQGVDVINFNDLANALKPIFLPGEHVEVRVVKAGEEPGQGVGYLDDGTMVVIEGGRDHVNQQVVISVTSVLQTSAGRMIFGRYESGPTAGGKN